jgi:hypothetical protein
VLAFSPHDVQPGRQTAAYLSAVNPGAPMAFAVCDQGSAAAFSGLRVAPRVCFVGRNPAGTADRRRAGGATVRPCMLNWLPVSCMSCKIAF